MNKNITFFVNKKSGIDPNVENINATDFTYHQVLSDDD
jgi:hypothetical protein